jgi:hypothetical protein
LTSKISIYQATDKRPTSRQQADSKRPTSDRQATDKRPTSDRQATDKRPTMTHTSSTSSTYHKIECAEVSGVFSQEKYHAYTYIDNDPNSRVYHDGIIGDYHLFIRSGNKVYVEAKGSKEVVMSFDDLQKNRYLKYYYDLSLILAKKQAPDYKE